MGKRDFSNEPVYHSRPYHAIYLTDDEDDDSICIWGDRPELPGFDDSEEEGPGYRYIPEKSVLDAKGKRRENRSTEPRDRRAPMYKDEDLTGKCSTIRTETTASTGSGKTRGAGATKSQEHQTKGRKHELQHVLVPWPRDESGKLTKEAFRERELRYALSTTRRNLTHVMQFMLKIEARAGKTSKEGIRQTLDATVRDRYYDFNQDGTSAVLADVDEFGAPTYHFGDHKDEIEELKELSSSLCMRMYLLDRTWRRKGKPSTASKPGEDNTQQQKQVQTPYIKLRNEPAMKEWLKVEEQTNELSLDDPSFYSVRDLASGRSFGDWLSHLRGICRLRAHPVDEQKLVELAWRFLDREIRKKFEAPVNPTTGEQFVAMLEKKRANKEVVWKEQLENPMRQVEDDAEAWKTLRKYWSCRTAPA